MKNADDLTRAIRKRTEKAIGQDVSEFPQNTIHDNVFRPITDAVAVVRDAIEAELFNRFLAKPLDSKRSRALEALRNLREMLQRNALERELQNELRASGMLDVSCKVSEEVSFRKTQEHRGSRLDIVVGDGAGGPGEIIELKRGSFLLLARSGTASQRVSRKFQELLQQAERYSRLTTEDQDAILRLDEECGLADGDRAVRTVAGRRLETAEQYSLLYRESDAASTDDYRILPTTWDGFLNELERIWT